MSRYISRNKNRRFLSNGDEPSEEVVDGVESLLTLFGGSNTGGSQSANPFDQSKGVETDENRVYFYAECQKQVKLRIH